VACAVLAVATAIGTSGSASSASTTPGWNGSVTTFPQGIVANLGRGLLRAGNRNYFEMVDEDGNATIGRIAPNGSVRTASPSGSGYVVAAPTITSDEHETLVLVRVRPDGSETRCLTGEAPPRWC
jgi:hypothetical protein